MTDTNDLQEETEYTYYYADGQCGRIKLGRDGIEKQSIINMLYEMDEETEKIENREDNAKCKKFQYQMAEHMRGNASDPIENLTYSEKREYFSHKSDGNYPTVKELRKILKLLSDRQRDLLKALYFDGKTMAQIAREENVTHEAIRQRRNRIFDKIRKIYNSMKGGGNL